MEDTCLDIRHLVDSLIDDSVLSLESGRYFGNLSVSKSVHLENVLDTEPILCGSVVIDASNVTFRGIKFTNTISVSGKDINFHECIMTGSVRLSRDCVGVFFKNCDISPERNGVGVTMLSPGECITFTKCSFSNCLLALSIQVDIISSEDILSDETPSFCSVNDCEFECNSTDVVVRISILRGLSPASVHAIFSPPQILKLHSLNKVSYDISLSGSFRAPLSFQEWPLGPLELTLPRRGTKGRNCYIKTLSSGGVHIWEDEYIAGMQRPLKRSHAEVYYSTILGIDAGSCREEILSAFKKLALIHHPDKCGETTEFIKIKKARDELINILDNCS